MILSFLVGTALFSITAKYGIEAMKASAEVDLPSKVLAAKNSLVTAGRGVVAYAKEVASGVKGELDSRQLEAKAATVYSIVKDMDEEQRNKILEKQPESVVNAVIKRLQGSMQPSLF